MDTIMEIKRENPLSEDIASQNEKVVFIKNATMKSNSDTERLDNVGFVTIKTEIESEISLSDLCVQKKGECFAKDPINQVKCETVTCRDNCSIDIKTESHSQNEREFLPEDPVMRVKEYNKDDEMGNKIEIKEEPWWHETDTSPMYNDIMDGDFTAVKSSGFCRETSSRNTSHDYLLPSAETSEKTLRFSYGKDSPKCESQESDVKEILPIEHVHSKEYGECSGEGKIYSKAFLILKDGSSQGHYMRDMSFNQLLPVKFNNLIHDGTTPYKCGICEKSFTDSSSLKSHNLVHKGIKPHKCEVCDKNFTQLSHLKRHNLIHEGKKPYKCEVCEESFTQLSSLKLHSLIHKGSRSHKCEICGKSFHQLSHLKLHNMIHEGKKPYKCEICEKTFTQLSNLKRHHLVHEGKKPHTCGICEKSFSRLSSLKNHNLVHEGKKPHKCEICEKSFTRLSDLKSHNLVHDGTSPHKCVICERSFIRLRDLKRHHFAHETSWCYRCETCGKSFSRLSDLRTHNLVHKVEKLQNSQVV